MKDLAPKIHRQRLIIEGTCNQKITSKQIKDYLSKLSSTINMTTLNNPVTHKSERFGWAGWIHWETSGAHFYAWDNPIFFSVDIYACKEFNSKEAIKFTQEFFDTNEIVFKEV